MTDEKVICSGLIEKINVGDAKFSHYTLKGLSINKRLYDVDSHYKAVKYMFDALLDEEIGVIKNINEVSAVGHRIVHGGKYFNTHTVITEDVIKKIEFLISLAPLHNKANLMGIKACKQLFGDSILQVAVFDTSYYSSMPPEAYMYPIPYEYFKNYDIRKYGFHGTSHEFVAKRYCEISKKDILGLKIISCHLGNGSSITAIKDGKAIDTSMGLTPLGGIMMGTRSGSLDPSVIFYMAEKKLISIEKIKSLLHKDSGLKGISGISSDDREVLKAENEGNKRAYLAHAMMIHQIVQFIGGYIATMNGCHAVIFTGGIGENQWIHRQKICKSLSHINLKIDEDINKATVEGKEGEISSKESKVDVYVIPTNEELAIARKTVSLILELNRGANLK